MAKVKPVVSEDTMKEVDKIVRAKKPTNKKKVESKDVDQQKFIGLYNLQHKHPSTEIGFINIIDQTHRFTLAGTYKHLHYLLKCSIRLVDPTMFDASVLPAVYEDVMKSIKEYFQTYPLDFRPTSKEDLSKMRKDINNVISNSIDLVKLKNIATIAINSLNLWDSGSYINQIMFFK
jgi:hypothetical protein